ncbi:hypothetical protein TRSC58_04649 [Trypanosoma rangeli SC58]|uniref:Uncharacterized protein n=1 Tax=Trypanosoma rangeli SC58 TaxID=429131 RepID=A0A061IWZ4_TRYRA|nr:hypothetical protein TRSC58_04649 [Trypanosoma rangeli SC58]
MRVLLAEVFVSLLFCWRRVVLERRRRRRRRRRSRRRCDTIVGSSVCSRTGGLSAPRHVSSVVAGVSFISLCTAPFFLRFFITFLLLFLSSAGTLCAAGHPSGPARMRQGARQNSGPARVTGLNSSDVAADAEHSRSVSRNVYPLTPLASFSTEDLAQLRRSSPDAYQALLQYEQLCRHDTAVIEAKEAELRRCISVGQEVLEQLDQLKARCSQLAGERDVADAKTRELERQLRRLEAAPHRGESEQPSAAMQKESQKRDDLLREQLHRCEAEVQQARTHAKELERELQEQRLVHDALKRDLEGAVQTARIAGVRSEAAETARRSAEDSLREMRLRVETQERELLRARAAQRELEEVFRQRQHEWATTSALYRDSQKPSAELVTAAAMLVNIHNQLQEVAQGTGRSHSRNQQPSLATSSQVTRLRLPTAVTDNTTAECSLTPGQLEHWFAHSLEETLHLVHELSRASQQVEERLRRCESELERVDAERQVALDEARNLGRENEQLRLALVALKEKVQALDAQTDRMREVDSLEVRRETNLRLVVLEEEKRASQAAHQRELERTRRQGALELASLQEHLETERRMMEREICLLRAELSQCHEEQKLSTPFAGRVTTALSPSNDEQLSEMKGQQLALQKRVEELGAENLRLREKESREMAEFQAEITRLEQVVQDGMSRYKRQAQQHEEEMKNMVQSKQELQRRLREGESAALHRVEELQLETKRLSDVECTLKSELLKACTQLESATAEERAMTLLRGRHEAELVETNRELETLRRSTEEKSARFTAENAGLREELEAKDMVIAALNRQLCDAGIEAAKMQDAIHRFTQKAKGLAEDTVSVDRYEEIETELMQEREQVHVLVSSLNAAQVQMEELRAKFDEHQTRVRDCLRQLPPSPAQQFAGVASQLQVVQTRAVTRLLAMLDGPQSDYASGAGSQREEVEVATPHAFVGDSTPMSSVLQSVGSSPLARVSMASTPRHRLQQPQLHVESSGGRSLSPPTSALEDDLSLPSTPGARKLHELAAAFSSGLHKFLSDLTLSIEQVLLRPHTHYWESLERLQRLCLSSSSTTATTDFNTTPKAQPVATDGGVADGNSGSLNNANENNWMEAAAAAHVPEDTDAGAMWSVVAGRIVDVYVDACAGVFRRACRFTSGYPRDGEEASQMASHYPNTNGEERVRRGSGGTAERGQFMSLQLSATQLKAAAARRSFEGEHAELGEVKSRYSEVCTRVEHLEEQLAAKKREFEAERGQWRETVGKLQLEHATRRQGEEERHQQLLRRADELRVELQNVRTQLTAARDEEKRIRCDAGNTREEMQKEMYHLERELQTVRAAEEKARQTLRDVSEQLAASKQALQQRQDSDMSRATQSERDVEKLKQELGETHAAHQFVQRLLQTEKLRSEAAESHSKDLSNQLAEQHLEIVALEQRVSELQEALWLQQAAVDAMTQEGEALQKVNRVLEERLAEVESEREPLRQQLQSLLFLEPH